MGEPNDEPIEVPDVVRWFELDADEMAFWWAEYCESMRELRQRR